MAAVALADYSNGWQADFLHIRRELLATLGEPLAPAVDVQHIGSTAVPGLCAKPVIDVLVGLPSLAGIGPAIPGLASAGYVYVPDYEAELPERKYFVKAAGTLPRVHVHAVCQGSVSWRQHLAFRNALRGDDGLRDRYAALKRALAQRHAQDKPAYTRAKAPFIEQVLASTRDRRGRELTSSD